MLEKNGMRGSPVFTEDDQTENKLIITDFLVHVGIENYKYQISNIKNILEQAQDEARESGFGLVLNPEDKVRNWKREIAEVDIVQLMTVYPGGQGRPFIPAVLDKIDELREAGFRGQILLDGGINEKSIGLIKLRSILPDAVCPGSWLKGMDELGLKEIAK